MDKIIREIVIRKKNGIDCTESESAEIKQYLLNTECSQHTIKTIQYLFPQEFSEYEDLKTQQCSQ